MQMQNASPRPTVHALQLLQQVMQTGRQTVFGGERRCKNTLPLSSDAKCTTCWSSQLLSSVPFTVHTRDSPKCILLLDSVLSSPVLCVCASLFLVSPSQLVHRRRQGQRRRPAAPRRQLEQPGRRLQLLRGEPATAGVGSVGSRLDSSIVAPPPDWCILN